jgi:NadR type nicotinamide-nucleotide adenylyltransferase
MKKVVILGPESTGKSTLSQDLTSIFSGVLVEEYAREYLNRNNGEYLEQDIVKIAKGQIDCEIQAELKCAEDGKTIIFYDTNITVLKIWSEFKFGKCHPWILEQYDQKKYDFYLLTYPDLDWEPDPLRENPQELISIFSLYEEDLVKRNLNYKVIKGQGSERTRQALDAVTLLI